MLQQNPEPGSFHLRWAGDTFTATLKLDAPRPGRAVFRTEIGGAAVARRETVEQNDLGATPLDFSANGQVQSIARRLTEGGFSVQSVWAMGSEIAAIDRAGEAEVNLVVSSVGLPAAEFLRERFGMPYVVGAPLGDTVSALLLGALLAVEELLHLGKSEHLVSIGIVSRLAHNSSDELLV